jgi:hypothetical protein
MFKEHGEFEMWVTKDILYARLSGAWNEETAIHYVKEFKRLVDWGVAHGGVYVAQVFGNEILKF